MEEAQMMITSSGYVGGVSATCQNVTKFCLECMLRPTFFSPDTRFYCPGLRTLYPIPGTYVHTKIHHPPPTPTTPTLLLRCSAALLPCSSGRMGVAAAGEWWGSSGRIAAAAAADWFSSKLQAGALFYATVTFSFF